MKEVHSTSLYAKDSTLGTPIGESVPMQVETNNDEVINGESNNIKSDSEAQEDIIFPIGTAGADNIVDSLKESINESANEEDNRMNKELEINVGCNNISTSTPRINNNVSTTNESQPVRKQKLEAKREIKELIGTITQKE